MKKFRTFFSFYHMFFMIIKKKSAIFTLENMKVIFSSTNLFKSPVIAGMETSLAGLHFSCRFQNYLCFIRLGSATLSNFDFKLGLPNENIAFLMLMDMYTLTIHRSIIVYTPYIRPLYGDREQERTLGKRFKLKNPN